MAKSTESYAVSRTNAVKYGIHIDGCVPCRGIDRCVYREGCPAHERGLQLPEPGAACPVEASYATVVASSLRETWRSLDGYVDSGLESLVHDAVVAILQRERVRRRQAAAWDLAEQEEWDSFLAEYALCDRYYAAALNRWATILERVERAREKRQYDRWRLQQYRLGLMQITERGPVPICEYPGPDWDARR